MEKVKKFAKNCLMVIKKTNKNILIMTLLVIVVLICAFGMVGLASYKYDWDNKFSNAVLKVLPIPAGYVEGKIIKMSDFKEEVKGVTQFAVANDFDVTREQVEKDVIDKLILQKAMEKLAKEFDVTVTPEDLDAAVQSQIDQLENADEYAENVEKYFGWDVETFKQNIIYIEVLRDNLIEAGIPKKVAEEKAQKVLAKVNKGKQSFEELAKEFSDDPGSSENGGDLGFFGKGVMVEAFENAVFALEVGQISDLVETEFGYHIIKVEDRRVDGENEQVQASHILIASENDFAVFFEDYKNELKIKNFISK
jgi:hypothetical protein